MSFFGATSFIINITHFVIKTTHTASTNGFLNLRCILCRTFFLALCVSLSACQFFNSSELFKPPAKTPTESEGVRLQLSHFHKLPGWTEQNHVKALQALGHSCPKIIKQNPLKPLMPGEDGHLFDDTFAMPVFSDLQAICQKNFNANTNELARRFLEDHFNVYSVTNNGLGEAFFTGYYEPKILAARQKQKGFEIPLRAAPTDIIRVDLARFDPALADKKLYGRLDGATLKPYWSRAEIARGALKSNKDKTSQDKPIAWVASEVDKFFLQIQGSGLLMLADGKTMRVGFAGRNGHPYTAIGKPLIERGELARETLSMQTIRAWLTANPNKAQEIMNLNASYIFFRELSTAAPIGAQGVLLTPEHSVAIDPSVWSYGLPLYLSVTHPGFSNKVGANETNSLLARLVIAQDTGSAIKGALRGDFFWGNGEYAAAMAGKMKSKGAMWVLLPKK